MVPTRPCSRPRAVVGVPWAITGGHSKMQADVTQVDLLAVSVVNS